MADFYGSNYTKAYVNVPSEKIPPGEISGDKKIAYDEYTFDGDVFAQNDIIKLGIKIPKGARVLEATVIAPSLGTTGIFSLGTSANPDALVVAADAGGAAVKAQSPAGAADLGVELSEDTFYELKCTEATDTADGLKIQVWVEYVLV